MTTIGCPEAEAALRLHREVEEQGRAGLAALAGRFCDARLRP